MQNKNKPHLSLLMRLALCAGLNKIAWSLRRLYCPVSPEDIVLEVGAGGNPYFRSNILVDAYEETSERHWVPLTLDRPTVLAFVEKLPFKDKQFDYVIASHVLEHSQHPEQFLNELQRVAKAGYIEVPDAFMERINPYPDHRLEITVRENKLFIKKKTSPIMDPELVELYEDRAKRVITQYSIPQNAFDFHVRYYWNDQINFVIQNPDDEAFTFKPLEPQSNQKTNISVRAKIQNKILTLVRKYMSQNNRNQKIDVLSMMRCTSCNVGSLEKKSGILTCRHCNSCFAMSGSTPDMTHPIPKM